jgi:hypothetical protein
MALVTLAQVKAHLRLTTAAGDPGDADLNQKMAAGEAAILNYVNRSAQGRTNSAAWVDPTTVPLDVQHAMLLKVGELDRFRGDDLADDGPDIDPDSGLSRAITSLLRRWSDPVIA